VVGARPDVQAPQQATVILLDTNALIWLQRNHARVAPLARRVTRLYVSPASLLEIQFLIEAGRLRPRGAASPRDLIRDDRWVLDDPPSAGWFTAALDVGWTHDPFDRLLVAHAKFRRWRLATSDEGILANLRSDEYVEL
jgi:PIN domain nuclease of toxin-antitoxin system